MSIRGCELQCSQVRQTRPQKCEIQRDATVSGCLQSDQGAEFWPCVAGAGAGARDLEIWTPEGAGRRHFRAAPITALEIQVYQAKNWRGEGSRPFLRLSIDSAYNCMIFCMETRIINRKIQFPAKLHRLQLPLESSLCTFFE